MNRKIRNDIERNENIKLFSGPDMTEVVATINAWELYQEFMTLPTADIKYLAWRTFKVNRMQKVGREARNKLRG